MTAWLDGMARKAALGLLWAYKRLISPFVPPACRFQPTCAAYAAEAFRAHSFPRAAWLSARRLAKCGPWHPGGYDPVPPAGPAPETAGVVSNDGRAHERTGRHD